MIRLHLVGKWSFNYHKLFCDNACSVVGNLGYEINFWGTGNKSLNNWPLNEYNEKLNTEYKKGYTRLLITKKGQILKHNFLPNN